MPKENTKPIFTKSAKNRSTGPTSAAGKKQSSQNALTHGATARRLVNDAEQQAYEAWVDQLSKTYPGENPLIRIQIERIAQLKVQLDRIQSAISALHEIERLKKGTWHRATKALEMTSQDIAHYAWTSIDTIVKKQADVGEHYGEFIEPAQELASLNDLDQIKSHADFLKRAPLFCKYLSDSASRAGLHIDEYVMNKKISSVEPEEDIELDLNVRGYLHGRSNAPLRNEIKDISLKDLIETAQWHLLYLIKFIGRSEKARTLLHVTQFVEQSALPDLDQLDKLMRYQTTINRQLSTAIGELLAMTRSPAM